MDETQNPAPVQQTGEPKSKKKLIIIGVAVVLGLLFIQSLLSPERMAERTLEGVTGGKVDLDADGKGSITVTGEDGAKIEITGEGSGKLPDNWPDSVPLARNASIEYAGTVSNGTGGVSMNVSYTTRESAEDVTALYADAFGKNGWTIAMNLTTGDGAMVSATKGEDAVVAYISKGDTETSVTVNVQVAQ